jgi:hypothetical protein
MENETKNELIAEGSALIAEFINAPDNPSGAKFTLEEYLCKGLYHKSWDWLIPCIKKISDELSYDWYMDNIVTHILDNNIQRAFEISVDAIKTHNESGGGN